MAGSLSEGKKKNAQIIGNFALISPSFFNNLHALPSVLIMCCFTYLILFM